MNETEETTEDAYAGAANDLRENSKIAQYENEENNRLQKNQQQESAQQNQTPEKKHVPWIRLWIMLLFAVLVDIISFLINLLPIIGGVLEAVIFTPAVIFIFWLWGMLVGVPLFRGVRKFVTPFVCIVGFIPVINAIPEWTFEVIALMLITMAEVYGASMLNKLPNRMKKPLARMVPKVIQQQVARQAPELARALSSSRSAPITSSSFSRPITQTSSSPSRKPLGGISSLVRK